MSKSIKQFEIWIMQFDPSVVSEIQKTRPGVVILNNILNDLYDTVIVAPLTSTTRAHFPSRIDSEFQGKTGQIALDQLKCFDKTRLKKKIGIINSAEQADLLDILHFIFQPEED